MKSKRTPSKKKKINPHFWVFCEGETEAAYVNFLRAKYRIPIEIITKITGNNLTQRKIDSFKSGKPTDQKDKDFLLYDADVVTLINKLESINAELILSNPSIEFWFLLHYKDHTSEISSAECIRQLCNRNKSPYKKGCIDSGLKNKLQENTAQACKRARSKNYPLNPSSHLYSFIKTLEEALAQKDI